MAKQWQVMGHNGEVEVLNKHINGEQKIDGFYYSPTINMFLFLKSSFREADQKYGIWDNIAKDIDSGDGTDFYFDLKDFCEMSLDSGEEFGVVWGEEDWDRFEIEILDIDELKRTIQRLTEEELSDDWHERAMLRIRTKMFKKMIRGIKKSFEENHGKL